MEGWQIALIIFIILLVLAIIIVVIVFVVRDKDKEKEKPKPKPFKTCSAVFGSSENIIGSWTSDNTTAVVNIYASTSTLIFDSVGSPSGGIIVSSTPKNIPISVEKGVITGVPVNLTYNVYFVLSDPTDDTEFEICGPEIVSATNDGRKMTIIAINLSSAGTISRNLSTNDVTYITGSTAPTPSNTWLYTGGKSMSITVANKTETVPAYTLSNTNSDGTRYYLYLDRTTPILKSGILSVINNNGLPFAQFVFTSDTRWWVLRTATNLGFGITGQIVSGSIISFTAPPTNSWINTIVS